MRSENRRRVLRAVALLCLLPATALAVEGSVNAELTGGSKALSLASGADISLVNDRLFLVTGYGFLKQADIPADGAVPALKIALSNFFSLGLDWTPSSHWLLSATFTFSPKATDTNILPIGPNGGTHVTLVTSRRSVQGLLSILYQSANFEAFDWSVDGSLGGAWNTLANSLTYVDVNKSADADLYVLKPSLGLTFTLFSKTDLALRGTYYVYSSDPTTAGVLNTPLLNAYYAAHDTTAQSAATITNFGGSLDTLSGYASAPTWFEARGSFLYRFTPHLTGRVAYTFVRYVSGHGYAHVVSTRFSWKMHRHFRLWFAGSVQYDDPEDSPSLHTSDPTTQPFWSGLASVGGEVTYDSD